MLYMQWLLDVCQAAGLSKPSVKPLVGRKGEVFGEAQFQLEGEGSLVQVTRLLHRFYSSDDLHRIKRFTVKRVEDSNNLDINVDIVALMLRQAGRRSVVGDLPSPRMKDKPVDRYLAGIVKRNLLSPANRPPALAAIQNHTATVGESMELTLKASDPDPTDELVFALDGEIPKGVSIDAKKGMIRWRPDQTGEIQLAVRVSDNGTPSLSDTQTVKVVVRDPPKNEDPDAIDDAKFAQVFGIVEYNNARQLLILVRTKGDRLSLSVGDRLKVGTFDGTVSTIDLDSAELTTSKGTVSVRIGQMLADARLVRQPIQQAGN
jgi:hypothetical protein